jgi:succinate dehydrogenase/fumarate reductase flavoprotein subunit
MTQESLKRKVWIMKKRTEGGMDRRDFLKGAALVGVGVVGAGALAACSPSSEDSETGGLSNDSTAGSGATTKPVSGTIVPEDWLGEQPAIADANVYETVDVDVVVLGGGHAGTQAALGAAQLGASVAVIETQSEDSYAYFGDDICSYNSQFMIGKGFGPYDIGEIVAEYVRRGCGRVSAPVIKQFVENSGEMMDNMVALVPETSNILDLEGGQCIIQIAYGKNTGSDYPVIVGGMKNWATTLQTIGTVNPTPVNGREGISRLTEIETYVRLEAERLGATWYWQHTATALQVEGNAVVGAYAEGPDGKYLKLNAKKGVLLTTGDFSGNPDMVYNLLDDVNEWAVRVGEDRSEMGGPGRDGMGHKLGCWAGGAMEPHPRPSNNHDAYPGPWGTVNFLALNCEGKRFTNEALAQYATNSLLRQPLGIISLVTDANFMEGIKRGGLDHGAPNWGAPAKLEQMEQAMKEMPLGPEGANIPQIAIINVQMDAMTAASAEGEGGEEAVAGPFGSGPNVWAASTVEEMLGYLGYNGEDLQTAVKSIEHYNELCHKGSDTDFGKDADVMIPVEVPPFYGAVGTNTGTANAGLVTLAGLLTDENLNVLKADRTGAIKGLYAAGNCLGQRYGVAYSSPSAGNSIGMAMTHGRVAGKIIAAL